MHLVYPCTRLPRGFSAWRVACATIDAARLRDNDKCGTSKRGTQEGGGRRTGRRVKLRSLPICRRRRRAVRRCAIPRRAKPRLADRKMKYANERDSARGWCAVEEINMRARLAHATSLRYPHPSPSFHPCPRLCATHVSFCSSLFSPSSTTPACLLRLSFSISISLSLSRRTPAVPFASGGDIYTRINPATRTRVPTYTAASPGHLVISVTSRTFGTSTHV